MAALPEPLPQNPLPLLDQWLADALVSSLLPNSNAFALATVGANNKPSVRMVLCKDLSITSGYLVFYTNYESPKAEDIVHMPRVAAVFNWSEQQRQARLEGIAIKSPENESERYFATRDVESQIGAWASRQSQPLVSRNAITPIRSNQFRGRTTGAVIDYGLTQWSYGSAARLDYMTALAGTGSCPQMKSWLFRHHPGESRAYSLKRGSERSVH